MSDDVLPTGPAKTARMRSMFDTIAPRYDLVNRLMTLGLDQGWRRATVDALGLAPGSLVLDLACGTGDLGAIAERRGEYRTFGADLSWGMLVGPPARPTGRAVRRAAPSPGRRVGRRGDLRVRAAELHRARRVLRRGGPGAPARWPPRRPRGGASPGGFLRFGHHIWFDRVVPVLGGGSRTAAAYRYLPRSTAYLPDEAGLRGLLRTAGFSTVGCRLLYGGLSQLLTATRRGLPDPRAVGGPDEARRP